MVCGSLGGLGAVGVGQALDAIGCAFADLIARAIRVDFAGDACFASGAVQIANLASRTILAGDTTYALTTLGVASRCRSRTIAIRGAPFHALELFAVFAFGAIIEGCALDADVQFPCMIGIGIGRRNRVGHAERKLGIFDAIAIVITTHHRNASFAIAIGARIASGPNCILGDAGHATVGSASVTFGHLGIGAIQVIRTNCNRNACT